MPRPDYIANLHAAKYDLRFCSGSEKPEMLRRYKTALEVASRRSGFTGPELEAAVAPRFRRLGETRTPPQATAAKALMVANKNAANSSNSPRLHRWICSGESTS